MALRGGPFPSPAAGRRPPSVSVTVEDAPNIPLPSAIGFLLGEEVAAPAPAVAAACADPAVRLDEPPEPWPLLVGFYCMAPC